MKKNYHDWQDFGIIWSIAWKQSSLPIISLTITITGSRKDASNWADCEISLDGNESGSLIKTILFVLLLLLFDEEEVFFELVRWSNEAIGTNDG